MSTTGQWVGAIAGGVIGFFTLGGPMGAVKGAAYGAALGGYIDPPPGPNLRGPTLDDKSFQSSAYGVSLATLHGTIATMGNIIYLENNEYKAVSKKESQGGKGGGGGGTYETTTYYATFAVALCEANPGSVVRRIWAGGKLIYSAGSGDFNTTLQSITEASGWHYYDGSQTDADSRMESVLGAGNCPSYEGTAYIIFYDFDLTNYGNGLAGCPIKVEIVSALPGDDDGDDGVAFGYIDASGVAAADGLHKSNCPIRAEGKALTSVVGWATQGSDVDAIAYHSDISFPGGSPGAAIELNPASASKNFSRSVLDGESNSVPCWLTYYKNAPGTELDRYEVTDNVGASYFYDGWNISSVHDHSETGTIFSLSETSGSGRALKNASSGAQISVVPGAIAVGGGIVANCRAGGIDIYDSGLSAIRTIPNLLNVTTRQGLTIFKNVTGIYLVVVGSFQSLNIGVFNYSIVDTLDGSYTSHSIDLGESFHVEAGMGSYGNPTLSHYEKIFAYGNYFSKSSGAVKPYAFIYFSLPAQYGGMGTLTPGAAKLIDIVGGNLNRAGIESENYNLDELEDIEVNGYRLEAPITARGALNQLQVAYFFDLIEDGYFLRAVRRGGESLATIYHSQLIREGEKIVSSETEGQSQLPSRYTINYLDYAREYDSNAEYADYPSLTNNQRAEQLAIVMTADQAAKLCDVLINLAHIESKPYAFMLPQPYLWVKPSDVLTVEVYPGYFINVRVDSGSRGSNQTIKINTRRAEQSVYQSSAVGSVIEPPPETIPLISDSSAVLLDIPMILNDYDSAGFVAAMYGLGTWPGGVLFRSLDSGQTFSPVQSFSGKTTAGRAVSVLGESDGAVIDRVSELELAVLAGDFFSITEAQMMTGKNYAAYGMDGRWEIVQFSGAVVAEDGRIKLSNFVRGLRGTEWATGLHEVNDYFVLLDDPDNRFIGYDLSQLMISRQFKAVTVGANVQDAAVFNFTYGAVNLKPLSPVNCIGEIVGSDWHVEFSARTRYQGSPWYSGVQPQNEPVLAFAVEILEGADVVRTLSISTEDFIYTEAQQIEDFGSAQTSITIVIYQISASVGRGYPLEVTL
jgi:hypothetical protein